MRFFVLSLLLACAQNTFAQKSQFGFFHVEAQDETVLRIADLAADVALDGAFAETTLDIGYANDSLSALQGLFKIHLPEGAVVRDFALRLGDKWQFGTLTEKHKARQTFEEIVRRGADPAVLAWNNGAEYQVRIFPFPAKGKRFIRLRYWQDLHQMQTRFVYSLPLPGGIKLDSFRLKFTAHAPGLQAFKVSDVFASLTYLQANANDKGDLRALIEEQNFAPPAEFRVTAATLPGTTTWTGKATPQGDLAYVGARIFAELPRLPRVLPKTVLVFADSGRGAKPDNELETASRLKALLAQLPKGARVRNYEFDAGLRSVPAIDYTRMTFDGGTNYMAVVQEIVRQRQIQGTDLDAIILSDAIPNMQREAEFADLKIAGAKIFFLPTKTKFNPHFAALLTEKSGGSVLPLGEIDSAIRAYSEATCHFAGLRTEDGSVTDVYPEPGTTVSASEGLGVYFRSKPQLIPRTGSVLLHCGEATQEYKIDFSSAAAVPEVQNLWAMKKLINLAPVAEEYAQDLAAHALRYQLVSPLTSYIVLENTWDYQRFNIAQRAENSAPAETQMMMKGAQPEGALGARAAAPPPAPEQAMDMMMADDANFGTKKARVVARPIPLPAPVTPSLEGARNASDVAVKYSKGLMLFGRLKKTYDELNTPEMKDPWFFVEMANAFSRQGETDRALRVLSNLFAISEEDGKALRTLGLVGCFQNNCDLAIQAFKMAIALRPEEPQNYRDLAWLYAEGGRLKEAQKMFAELKGKAFHSRFPGMDQLLARESAWIDSLVQGHDRGPAGEGTGIYTWITWNNDNSDADFHIRESKGQTVWYQNRRGKGELSNDFTQGYGPEVYTASDKNSTPDYFVNYYRADATSASQAVVVKFAEVERMSGGQVRIRSKVFPLYVPHEFVRVD